MKIRKAKKGDWKRCNEIVYACVNQIKIIPKMKKFLKRRYTLSGINKLSKTSDIYVCEKYGKVQASGKLSKKGHEIGMIYVHPKYQGQKIGTKIMNNLEGLAKKRGLKMVYVNALLPAIEFYKKLGYKKIKCKGKDYCRMEKKLK